MGIYRGSTTPGVGSTAKGDAEDINIADDGNIIVATNVEDALQEIQTALNTAESNISTNATAISDHLADTTDAHDASAVSNVPAGSIAATDVQAAINELDTEKQPLDATLTALAGTLTAANKIPYATATDTAGELDFKDEDDMASDSATAVPSQQSTKAYVDSRSNLLTEYEVTGSAVTSIDFQGLDINTHKSYKIELEWYNPTGSSADMYSYCNNDTTATNYYTQYLTANSTTVAGAQVNTPAFTAMLNGSRGLVATNVALVDNGTNAYMSLNAYGPYGSGASTRLNIRSVSHTVSQSNITRLTFTSTVASSIGIGSKIRIYRGDV